MNRLTTLMIAAAMAASIALPAAAGNWTVEDTPFGVVVSNETTNESFHAVNRKAGERQAKILNKIEDKDSGLYDDGSGPCSDPASQILC
jgi:hypothetical protein